MSFAQDLRQTELQERLDEMHNLEEVIEVMKNGLRFGYVLVDGLGGWTVKAASENEEDQASWWFASYSEACIISRAKNRGAFVG